MLGDPPTWLIFAGVIAALIVGVFLGDALGREVRAMLGNDRSTNRSDEPSRDEPAPFGDVWEVPHDVRSTKR